MPSSGKALSSRAEELVRRYLEDKTLAWSKETLYKESRALRDFIHFLNEERLSLNGKAVLAFAAHVKSRLTPKGRPWSAIWVFDFLSILRRWLRWSYVQGHLLQDLGAQLALHRPARLPRALSEGSVERLLDQGPRPGDLYTRDRAILELLYGTGLRASEVCRLELDDVDFAQGLLFVRMGKGRKDRIVPFGERARKALIAYLRDGRCSSSRSLFVSVEGKPVSRAVISETVSLAGRRAKIDEPVSAHRLRHSYATHLLRHGASPQAVQALLGHASLSSTQIYLDLDVSDLARMLEKSHPRAN